MSKFLVLCIRLYVHLYDIVRGQESLSIYMILLEVKKV